MAAPRQYYTRMTPEQKAAYVAAFIDGEGHIGLHRNARGFRLRSIQFVNTDRSLIDVMVQFLADLGFRTAETFQKITKPNHNDRWIVSILGGRQMFARFAEIIPIQSEKKRAVLREMIESYNEAITNRAARSTLVTRVCANCSKEFRVWPSIIMRGQGLCCSGKCSGLTRRKRVTNTCITCGNPFQVLACKASVRLYCSNACHGENPKVITRLKQQSRLAAKTRWTRYRQAKNSPSP